MMNSLSNLTSQQLRKAAAIKDKLLSLQRELNKLLGAGATSPVAPKKRKTRKMSPAGRARIIAAQKARWAKIKGKGKKKVK
jgi:hypothetical protein